MAKPRVFRRTLVIGAVVVALLAVIAALASDWTMRQASLVAEAARWKIEGAPCRSVSKAEYDAATDAFLPAGYTGLKVEIDDVKLAWSSGDSACHDILDAGSLLLDTHPVCQFTHPRKVRVTSPAGEHFYLTGESPATVSAAPTGVACVLNAKLRRGVKL